MNRGACCSFQKILHTFLLNFFYNCCSICCKLFGFMTSKFYCWKTPMVRCSLWGGWTTTQMLCSLIFHLTWTDKIAVETNTHIFANHLSYTLQLTIAEAPIPYLETLDSKVNIYSKPSQYGRQFHPCILRKCVCIWMLYGPDIFIFFHKG